MQKLIVLFFLTSCAGPTSPFGALTLAPSQHYQESHLVELNPLIEAKPSFKLYHKSYDLIVDIEDEMISEIKHIDYQIIYNKRILNRAWETEEVILYPDNPNRLSLRFKNFRLNPLKTNEILFTYKRDRDGKVFEASLKEPDCPSSLLVDLFNNQEDIFKNDISYYELKAMIFQDKIGHEETHQGFQGGIQYLKYLENYWMQPDQEILLETIYQGNIPWSDIILASYNSGTTRVKKAIISKGKRWNDEEALTEAKRYVSKIKSVCTAFHRSY